MVNYKEAFEKFYNDSISLSDNVDNYTFFIQRGLSLCILKKCIDSNDIPLGVELSAESIFKILNIDINECNIDLNFFKNYIVLKLISGTKILSLSNPSTPKMTQICSYNGTFVMSPEYCSFEPIEKLANDLDIPLYAVETKILKSKFTDLISDYTNANFKELMLLGCVDKFNVVGSDFNLNAEMKKLISASHKEDKSIYDYLKDDYISSNLNKYIKKYPSIKDSKTFINGLLLKYMKAELVPSSELLTDKIKNDFKNNINNSIAQRKALEKFIYKGWSNKHEYDRLLDTNEERMALSKEMDKLFEKDSKNIVIKIENEVVFESDSSGDYRIDVVNLIRSTVIGKYTFKELFPVIQCYNADGFPTPCIKVFSASLRKKLSIYKEGKEIYPCVQK